MRLHADEAYLSEVLLPLAEVSVRMWNAKYRLLGAGGVQSLENTWRRVARSLARAEKLDREGWKHSYAHRIEFYARYYF